MVLRTPRCSVPAEEPGYHNRNLIQAFYSQEETLCIPSNNRHCLNIHVLLCNKSSSLLHTCACTHPHSQGSWWKVVRHRACACVSVCLCICISINHPSTNCWAITPSILVNMSSTGPRKNHPTFLKVMKSLMRGCRGNGHVKTSAIYPH